MFVGFAIAGSHHTTKSVTPDKLTYNTLIVKNAVYDNIYSTSDVIENFDGSIPDNWNYDTYLYAKFENDLYGGNVSFTESIVDSVRIKRRTEKDSVFKTIYEKEINENEDFQIEFIDYLEPIGTIEYAYVPVISGGESNYISNSVVSDFDNFFICEKDKSYPMIINAEYNQTINYESSNVKPLGRKYPITVVNGNTGYKTGEMSATFVDYTNCILDVANAFEYRNIVYDMLINKQPKILKDHEGNLLIINIIENITEDGRQYLYQGADKTVQRFCFTGRHFFGASRRSRRIYRRKWCRQEYDHQEYFGTGPPGEREY